MRHRDFRPPYAIHFIQQYFSATPSPDLCDHLIRLAMVPDRQKEGDRCLPVTQHKMLTNTRRMKRVTRHKMSTSCCRLVSPNKTLSRFRNRFPITVLNLDRTTQLFLSVSLSCRRCFHNFDQKQNFSNAG